VIDDRKARACQEIPEVTRRIGRAQQDCRHRDSSSLCKMDRAE
jgi:hypothetical protein